MMNFVLVTFVKFAFDCEAMGFRLSSNDVQETALEASQIINLIF